MKNLLRAYGILLLLLSAVLLYGTFMLITQRPAQCNDPSIQKPCGFYKPMIALELVGSPAEFQQVVQEQGSDWVKSSLRLDDFVIIPLYWLSLLCLSALLFYRHDLWGHWLGLTAAVCATAT